MQRSVNDIAASCLVILFVYSGLNKLLNHTTFQFELGRSPYLTKIADLVAWAVPITEILLAVLLSKRKTRLAGFYLSFFLMFLFTGYIYLMLNYSPYLPCSCGGVLASLSRRDHLLFNTAFLILSVVGVFASQNYKLNKQPLNAGI